MEDRAFVLGEVDVTRYALVERLNLIHEALPLLLYSSFPQSAFDLQFLVLEVI